MFPGILKKCSELRPCISFNIDGVPLFKSINVQLWPIICSIKGFEPFVVILLVFKTKFVGQLSIRFFKWVIWTEKKWCQLQWTVRVSFSAFVCDDPARSYHGCERCVMKDRLNNLITFHSDRMHTLRTDEKFQNFEYKDHQLNRSSLLEIKIEYIEWFPLDYMHLVCLGDVK